MKRQISSATNGGKVTRWYWDSVSQEIIENFGTASIVIGYASTEEKARAFCES